MRTLEIADAEVMQVAIRQEIDRSEESRYDHRLHRVLLVDSDRSSTAVSQLFGEDATTVQRWVRRRAPRDGPSRWTRGRGRVWRLTCVTVVVQHLWDGTLLAEHLRQRIDRCQVAPFYYHSILTVSIVMSRS
jgi:hypothetical protein